MNQTTARIFPANQRGFSQSPLFRTAHVFNSGDYSRDGREPFGHLLEVNEDTLSPHYRMKRVISSGTTIVLIPLVGSVKYSCPSASGVAEAGTCHIIPLATNTVLELYNPFETEMISVLRLHISGAYLSGERSPVSLPLDSFGQMTEVNDCSTHSPWQIYIGRLQGREDYLHRVANPGSGVFAFVIEGVVEVQHRLLDPRDSLALWNEEVVACEALSAEAILVLIEVGKP